VNEATGLLRCHRVTLLRLIRRGALHPVRVGRSLKFYRAEVVAMTNSTIAVYPHLRVVARRGIVPTR
jgi:excisionase family DNA binding protein